jgi:hypothetical protein
LQHHNLLAHAFGNRASDKYEDELTSYLKKIGVTVHKSEYNPKDDLLNVGKPKDEHSQSEQEQEPKEESQSARDDDSEGERPGWIDEYKISGGKGQIDSRFGKLFGEPHVASLPRRGHRVKS